MGTVMYSDMTIDQAQDFINSYGGLFPIEVAKSRHTELNRTYNASGLCTAMAMEMYKLEKSLKLVKQHEAQV